MKVSAVAIRRGLNHIKQLLSNLPNRSRGNPTSLQPQTIYQPMARQTSMTTMMINPLAMGSPPPRRLAPLPRSLPSIQTLVNGFYANANVAPTSDFYANCNTADAQINSGMEALESDDATASNANVVLGPLAVAADLKLYEDFLALENTGYPIAVNSDASLKGLSNAMYETEKNTDAHKSGFLLHLLMWYFRQNFMNQPGNTVTFTTFITTLSEADIGKIWNINDDGGKQEYIRRFKQGVRYLTPEKQEKYHVYLKNGRLFWAKWSDQMPLDTTVAEYFKRKHEGQGVFEKDQIAIWVMSKEDKLYTHAAKIHRFHHSSFTRGDVVRCAGDWEVKDGKLQWISAASGHYKPSFENLRNAIQILANKYGISANSFKVKLFRKPDTKTVITEFVSASRFLFDFNAIKQNYVLVP